MHDVPAETMTSYAFLGMSVSTSPVISSWVRAVPL